MIDDRLHCEIAQYPWTWHGSSFNVAEIGLEEHHKNVTLLKRCCKSTRGKFDAVHFGKDVIVRD